MAINLTIPITDTEQTAIVAAAERIAPGMSPTEVKAWCEAEAKRLLRERIRQLDYDARIEAENAARRTAEESFAVAWPEPVEDPAPE